MGNNQKSQSWQGLGDSLLPVDQKMIFSTVGVVPTRGSKSNPGGGEVGWYSVPWSKLSFHIKLFELGLPCCWKGAGKFWECHAFHDDLLLCKMILSLFKVRGCPQATGTSGNSWGRTTRPVPKPTLQDLPVHLSLHRLGLLNELTTQSHHQESPIIYSNAKKKKMCGQMHCDFRWPISQKKKEKRARQENLRNSKDYKIVFSFR